MLMIVNPAAAGGRAHGLWERIRPAVQRRVGDFAECGTGDPSAARACIQAALAGGEKQFVAVGGDGTVNLVIDVLASAPRAQRSHILFGAIGLGSSNDFHKPVSPSTIDGFPCRLDFARAVAHDVGRLMYVDARGERRTRYWLSNASVGVTAQGNRVYNEARGLVGVAKRCSPSLGMLAAAVQAVCARSQIVMVAGDGGPPTRTRVSNLGIVKNPHFTGGLRYDTPYEPQSGDFFVHLLAGASRWNTVVTLGRLARGRFSGGRSTRSWRSRWLVLDAPRPFPVEGDGEIVITRHAEFGLEPRALRVCT